MACAESEADTPLPPMILPRLFASKSDIEVSLGLSWAAFAKPPNTLLIDDVSPCIIVVLLLLLFGCPNKDLSALSSTLLVVCCALLLALSCAVCFTVFIIFFKNCACMEGE